ncbi:MAG: FmdB family zinc ribbon protein [Verrucomicrobiota bacterium]
MPIYEFKCKKCGHLFEYFAQKVNEKASECPECGAAEVVKQFSTFNAADSGSSSEGSLCDTGTCPTGSCPL